MNTAPATPRDPWYVLAELGCAALGIGLVVASVRLFSNGSAILTLAGVVLVAWALAALLRRSPLAGWAADLLHVSVGAVALLALAAPQQRWGALPTPASLEFVVATVRDDFTRFDTEVAPLVARTGHLVVMGSLLWLLTLFNSTTAMRLRAPVQAAVPHLVAFVGLGFVSRAEGRGTATAAMLVSLALYALTQVAWHDSLLRWVPRRGPVMARSLLSGAATLALAGVAAAVVAPALPGGPDPVWDLRRGGLGGDGPRTVVSPFVEVGTNLGARSDELLFTVSAERPQYWRLSALDDYDAAKAIWVLSNSYEAVDSPLDPDSEATAEVSLDVRGLGGIWVPAPERAVSAEADFALNWDPDAASLIRRTGELAEGDRVVFGARDATDAGALLGAGPEELRASTPASEDAELLDPSGAPPALLDLVGQLDPAAPYESLLALQQYFRDGFDYDESVDLGGTPDPLAEFLELRRGFCQQFSTAFALGARALGFESRVVVGFTTGDPVGRAEDGSATYAVRGRHAHAWPEVRFEELGWVPFEPTPGRGNPATTSITGVAGAQAPSPPGEPPPEDLPPPTTAPTGPTEEPGPPTTAPGAGAALDAGAEPGSPGSDTDPNAALWRSWAAAALAVAALVGLGWFVLARRRRETGAGRDPVAVAWGEAVRLAGRHGVEIRDHDTPLEFATRCEQALGRVRDGARAGLPGPGPATRLATLESARRWSATEPTGSPEAAGIEAATALAELEDRFATPAESRREEIPG